MGEPLRVLLIEDSSDDAALVARELRRGGWEPQVERVETPEGMRAVLRRQPWDLVIADYRLPAFDAPAALEVLRSLGLDLPFIIVSGAISEETAVAAMKAGAHDYVMKDNLVRLVPAVRRELGEAEARRERARAEEALARTREYAQLLVEGTNALILGLDLEARITLFNRAAEVVTGYRRAEVLGKRCFDVLVPAHWLAEASKRFTTFLATGEPGEFTSAIATATGEERVIEWRSTLVRAGDRVRGVICFGLDVTERQRAEEQRRLAERHARQAEKLAALGTLAAGLAHELNNPIGIMSSRIELLLLEAQAHGLPASVAEDLRVIQRHAQRVSRIAQGLLSFARKSPGERTRVDLNHVVRETMLLAERQIRRDGIEVRVDLDPALPPILGDANALQQVILNLVTNARDAVEGGGKIRITTRAAGPSPGLVQLTVADTGPGIAPEDASRIFDPFFSTKPTGTGLGLSITQGIVREHGGTIDVQSAPGQGTSFVLSFPRLATPS